MIVTVFSFVASHTPLTMRQVVRASLLAIPAWFTGLLLAIATTIGILPRDHVNRGAALGAQSSDMEANRTTSGKYGFGVPGESGELDGSDVSPETAQSQAFYVSNCNLPRF